MIMKIFFCKNEHYYESFNDKCPWCGKESVGSVEYQEGDCIACGGLCPENAYCCPSPQPLEIITDSEEATKEK